MVPRNDRVGGPGKGGCSQVHIIVLGVRLMRGEYREGHGGEKQAGRGSQMNERLIGGGGVVSNRVH